MFTKGNVPALVLVTSLLLLGLGVYTMSGDRSTPQGVDATGIERVEQEIAGGIEDASLYGVRSLASQGYSNTTEVWYCNAPYAPSDEEMRTAANQSINEQIRGVLRSLESDQINVTEPRVRIDLKGDAEVETVRLNLSQLNVAVESDRTEALRNLSEDLKLRTRAIFIFQQLRRWMGCDAGNVGTKLRTLLTNKTCKFEQCSCSDEPVEEDEIKELVEKHGLRIEEVVSVINDTTESLNTLMSGADSCTAPRGDVSGISCDVEIVDSVINNDMNINKTDVCHITGDADPRPQGTSDKVGRWPMDPLRNQYCPPNRSKTGSGPLDEDGYTAPKQVVIDNSVREEFSISDKKLVQGRVMALDKQASVTYDVTCRDRGKPEQGILPVTASIKLHLSAENECDYPEVKAPEDWEITTEWKCGASGGPNVCPAPGQLCGYEDNCVVKRCRYAEGAPETQENLECQRTEPPELKDVRCSGHPECQGACTASGCDFSESEGDSCDLGSCDIPGACSPDGECRRTAAYQDKKCCGDQIIDEDKTCCNGQVHPGNMRCCNGQVYDPSTHTCCGGSVSQETPDGRCCGQFYDTTGDCTYQGG